jgi:Uma2 family endonuclease
MHMTLVLENLPLPARIRPDVPMTDEELMRFSSANANLRIERAANGDLIVMTPSGSKTANMNMLIATFLTLWTIEDGRGLAFDSNGGFRLPDGSVLAADAAWVGRKRWDALSDEQQTGYAPLCPEFVIELRSPSDKLPELEAKMQLWIDNGAQVAWLIDPIRKVVEIYRPGQQSELLSNPTSVQGDGPIAGFELVMDRIWA